MRTTTSIDGTRRLLCATGQTPTDRCFSCEAHRDPTNLREGSEAKIMRLRAERGITPNHPNGHRTINRRRITGKRRRPTSKLPW